MLHFVTAQLQKTPQHVLKNKGAEIANVREIVDRWPASIHLHFVGFQRNEWLHFAGIGVVDADFVHSASGEPFVLLQTNDCSRGFVGAAMWGRGEAS